MYSINLLGVVGSSCFCRSQVLPCILPVYRGSLASFFLCLIYNLLMLIKTKRAYVGFLSSI